MNNITNVFVIDDNASVRDSLRMMLKAEGYAVATFSGADEFLPIFTRHLEGCIILDVNMPDMDGVQLQEELNRRGSHLPIIFLTGVGSIPLSVSSIKAGAIDFLTKPVDPEKLLASVKQAMIQCQHLQSLAHQHQLEVKRLTTLTKREKEIVDLVINGLTSKEIAQKLNLSHRTVDNYRANIMHKTGCSNIIELSRLASISTST